MKSYGFLVVGRSGRFLSHMRSIFDDLGYTVEYTSGFKKGLTLVESGNFRILIVDIGADREEMSRFVTKCIDSGMIDYVLAVTDNGCRDMFHTTETREMVTCLPQSCDKEVFRDILRNIARLEKSKTEVIEKEKRVLELEVINQIARETLAYGNGGTIFWDLARIIREKIGYYNVNIFLMDGEGERIVLKAFAGVSSDDQVAGFSLRLGEGICGWVAQNRESLMSGDVSQEPRRLKGFDYEENVNSELAVPILSGDSVYGVLHVESTEFDAFTEHDLLMIETVSDQMALAIKNVWLSQELLESKKLTETINDSLPLSIVVLDKAFQIEYANMTFCEINNVRCEDILGKPLESVFSEEFLRKFDLSNELKKVIEYGISITHSNVRHTSPYHPERILNVSFKHLKVGDSSRVMVIIQDLTDFTQKTYQLLLLREISLAMQGVLERDKLLHLILTCVTAGFAVGFNRAFLFLVDDKRRSLRGIMGVGPSSREEAYRIWDSLSRQPFTFQDYLEQSDRGTVERDSLQDLVGGMVFDLQSTRNALTETVETCNYVHILNAWEDPRVDDKLRTLLATKEFVAMPLIVKNEVIGVLMADNAYSGRNISFDSIEVLTMLGSSAAIAIENAQMLKQLEEKIDELEAANVKLKKTQDILIRKEKLAAIGEVSTRLAHEIRNPLTVIGGFAKSIPKRYENRERTIRNANIIVEEVRRLEQILTSVLDFSKPATPKKIPTDINELIEDTLGIMETAINGRGVITVFSLSPDKLNVEIDADQIKQVLFNIIQNAINAMPEGGALEIRTGKEHDELRIDVTDTGCGIPDIHLENIFEPFFTTWGSGTGLGLSISQMIIQNHGGRISVSSKDKKGTTFSIFLPCP